MCRFGLVMLVVLAALVLAVVFLPRKTIETSIQIDATPAQVWSLLGNPPSYRSWNPFIVSMQGRLAVGETLINDHTFMTFSPTVTVVDPEVELRWLGRLWVPRIFDGEHYFLLAPNEEGTLLTHGENFHCLLLFFTDVEQFREDFERMNLALKTTVEQGLQ